MREFASTGLWRSRRVTAGPTRNNQIQPCSTVIHRYVVAQPVSSILSQLVWKGWFVARGGDGNVLLNVGYWGSHAFPGAF